MRTDDKIEPISKSAHRNNLSVIRNVGNKQNNSDGIKGHFVGKSRWENMGREYLK